MLRQTIRASVLSVLFLQGSMAGLFADAVERTFNDGTKLKFSLAEGEKETSAKPQPVTETHFTLPFIGELFLKGKGELTEDAKGNLYTVKLTPKIDPDAALENLTLPQIWKTLKPNVKGEISVQIGDIGETIHAVNFIIQQENWQFLGEKLDYSHEFKKKSGEEALYENKTKLVIENGESVHLNNEPAESTLEISISKVKEILLDFSYLSGEHYEDYRKDLKVTCAIQGEKDFRLNGDLSTGFPFEKTAGAEKMEGYTFNLSVPTIDWKIEGEEAQKALRTALTNNISGYAKLLEQHPGGTSDILLASIRKHREEIINRLFKYYTEFAKEDVRSLFVLFKIANSESETSKYAGLAELDLTMHKFKLKSDYEALQSGDQKLIMNMPQPESSIQEVSKDTRKLAWTIEPVLKDLGYWEMVQNFSEPEKILTLLRQLSDDPKAKGDAPLTITVVINAAGVKVGTLTQEQAAAVILSWTLQSLPLPQQ